MNHENRLAGWLILFIGLILKKSLFFSFFLVGENRKGQVSLFERYVCFIEVGSI